MDAQSESDKPDCPVEKAGRDLLEIRRQSPQMDLAPPVIGARVRVYKQDPTVTDLSIRTVYLPADIQPGPRDAVILNAGTPRLYPNVEGDLLFNPSAAPAEFDTAHTFAVVRMTLTMFERMLDSAIPWQWNRNGGNTPIQLFPYGGEGANAHYWREYKELRFFHFVPDGRTDRVYTCRSLDIVGHEAGHAVLDALRPDWWAPGLPPQVGGLHESFGDLAAILLILSQYDLAEFVVAETKADLHQKSVLSALAEEFGAARFRRPSGLRNANNSLKLSQVSNEVHDISEVFTGGTFDVLADLCATRRSPRTKDDTEVLHETAAYLGKFILQAFRDADTSTAGRQQNAFRAVAEKMAASARDAGDNDLATLIEHHFRRREVLPTPNGPVAFDFPDVPARVGGNCGTARIRERQVPIPDGQVPRDPTEPLDGNAQGRPRS